jgi:hypothetical protein
MARRNCYASLRLLRARSFLLALQLASITLVIEAVCDAVPQQQLHSCAFESKGSEARKNLNF